MPRFDNFTNQLDKLPRPTSTAAWIDAKSDAILVLAGNGRHVTAAMSQDMSAFMEFMALGSPNTAMSVSTTTNKASQTFGPVKKVFNSIVTVVSQQAGGATAAAFDVMRSDTRVTQSASLIDDTTDVGRAQVLSIGSRWSVSSVASIYSMMGSGNLIRNYYADSGTGNIMGGNHVFMTAMVK